MRMTKTTTNSARRAGRTRLHALVFVMSVVTAACGSTVAVDGQGLPRTIQDQTGVTADEQAQGLTVPSTSPSDPAVAVRNPGTRGGQSGTTGSSTTGTSGWAGPAVREQRRWASSSSLPTTTRPPS